MLWITAWVKRLLKACLSAFPKTQRDRQIGRERTRETERDQGNECCAFLTVAPVEHSLQMKSSRKELFVGRNWNTFLKSIKFGNFLYFILSNPGTWSNLLSCYGPVTHTLTQIFKQMFVECIRNWLTEYNDLNRSNSKVWILYKLRNLNRVLYLLIGLRT